MGFAAAILAPLALRDLRRAANRLATRTLGIVGLSGALLTGHFLLWTASLQLTSIASSVLLVCLHPLAVAPLSRRFLGEAVTPRTLAGITLALVGAVVTCVGDLRLSGSALVGDGLALAGAACLAGYLLIGRGIRAAVGVAGYSAVVFGLVSFGALLFTTASGVLHAPSPRVTLACLALAVVCTLFGHAAYNWALRHVAATVVSIAFLGEPPIAAALGFVILGSRPAITTVAGGLVILAGLGLTLGSTSGEPALADSLSVE